MNVLTTGLFTLFGLMGWILSPNPGAVWVQALVYGLLMVHTWFSVRFFFRLIDPNDRRQRAINGALVFAYALLAWSIRDMRLFYLVWAAFFCLTVFKYVLLVGRFEQPRPLRRKLVADLLGVAMGILMTAMLWFWPNQPWQWLGLVLFGGSCIYYLFLRPLYDTSERV